MACRCRCGLCECCTFGFYELLTCKSPIVARPKCESCVLDEALDHTKAVLQKSPKGTKVTVERPEDGPYIVTVTTHACYSG
jgi:hypothetical protein